MGAAIAFWVVVLAFCLLPVIFLVWMLSDKVHFAIGLVLLAGLYWFYSGFQAWIEAGRPNYQPKTKSMVAPAPGAPVAVDWAVGAAARGVEGTLVRVPGSIPTAMVIGTPGPGPVGA